MKNYSKQQSFIAGIAALMILLTGCGGSAPAVTEQVQTTAQTAESKSETTAQTTEATTEQTTETTTEQTTETTTEQTTETTAESSAIEDADEELAACKPVTINFRFADAEEGEQRLLAQTEYLDALTQNDLDYRVGKSGATLDDFKKMIHENMLDYSDQEKAVITKYMGELEDQLNELGFAYDIPEEIVFIKTTMHEEGDAGAYTHGTEIYMGSSYCDLMAQDEEIAGIHVYLCLVHEFFHCMTRENADFRRDMYSIINTQIDSSIELKPEMRANILSNPDVERYDNYAVFDIDGTPTECMIVTYVEDYQEDFGSFFDHIQPALLPIKTQDKFYMADDIPDFYKVVGENTGYVIAAEECLADNFSYAVIFGSGGPDDTGYPTQRIIDDILDKCSGK